MTILVGTSGWQYESWRHRFHAGVPQRRWFEHTLQHFRTVELNVSFYRLPPAATFAGWRERSPDDAVLAVKASRYLTHIRRLRDPAEPVARLIGRASGLGPKLGPFLLQLPPDMRSDVDGLAATLQAFGPARVAVETRHESWWCDDVRAVLTAHGAATVWADRLGRVVGPTWRTAPWGYVRLHHGDAAAPPHYRRSTLARWVDRIGATFEPAEDVFVYFNNDPEGAAVDDAVVFAAAARDAGHDVSRTPPADRPPHPPAGRADPRSAR